MNVHPLRKALEEAAPAEDALPNAGAISPEIIRELARLATLHPLTYEQEREEAARRLGISRLSALDKEVERLRAPAPAQSAGSGRSLDLSPPDPWPDPVDLAKLLNELESLFTKHLALPDHASEALALWVLHTYVADASFITPRLAITSPEKRCGKSTLLELVAAVTCKPLIASNITAPALFRTVEIARPTLFIDEADTFLRENEELRGVLNSGHGQSGSVIRTVELNGEHEPRRFSTWCPVAIALIGELPGTLADRSITISMRRKGPGESKQRYRRDRPEMLPWRQLPVFMVELRKRPATAARALEFLILTAARTSEVMGATSASLPSAPNVTGQKVPCAACRPGSPASSPNARMCSRTSPHPARPEQCQRRDDPVPRPGGQQASAGAVCGDPGHGAGGHPPRTELGRQAAPLGAILAAPDDRLDRAAQIVVLGLAVRAAGLDQRFQHRPLSIRQHAHHLAHRLLLKA